MSIGRETEHPKEAILREGDLLKEKLDILEKKLVQIGNELLGAVPPTDKEKAPTPESSGFLANIQEHLHRHCVNVDKMVIIANKVVQSLVTGNEDAQIRS